MPWIDDPPAAPATTGGRWIDEPPVTGGKWMEGDPVAVTGAEVEARLADLSYDPTPAEFKVYKAAQDAEPWSAKASKFPGLAWDAFAGLIDTHVQAAKQAGKMALNLQGGDLAQSVLEAGGRGILQDWELGKKIVNNAIDLIVPGVANAVSLDDYIAQKQLAAEAEQSPGGILRGRDRIPMPPLAADTLARWSQEYQTQYLPQIEFENFIQNRDAMRQAAAISSGQHNVVPEIFGKAANELAEAGSLTLSPISVATFGLGSGAKTGATVAERAAAGAGSLAGRSAQAVGRGMEVVGEMPGRMVRGVVEGVTDSAEAAAAAQQMVERGSLAATLVSPAIAVPGLTETAVAAQAAKRGGQLLGAVGTAAEAASRAVSDPILSQRGMLWNISKDATAPLWLRQTANTAVSLDPALSFAGRTAESAVMGAGMGAALGFAAEGNLEGVAGGFGSGAALGPIYGTLGHLVGSGAQRRAAGQRDLARWLSGKSEPEIQNIRNMNLSEADALKVMEVELQARGLGGAEAGDILFRYVTPEEFRAQFGDSGKGAQLVEGDKPIVVINTGYEGPNTVFHEVGHAISELKGLEPQQLELRRILFSQTTPDGTVLTRGIYNAADLADFERQYLARLSPEERTGLLTLTPEERQARIQSEIVADSFANLLSGSARGPITGDSLRRRVADQALLANNVSLLGRMRRALEAVGVTLDATGSPSELFVKDGRPVTNSPRVNAALREYLRAKGAIVRRLTAGEGEALNATIRPEDFLRAGNEGLVAAYQDWDGFARNPDGSVKMVGGLPVMLSERDIAALHAQRYQMLIDALRRAPDPGDPGALRELENGSWRGRYLSDTQLAAMRSLPDNVLSPSMKAKIASLSAMARQTGQQILMDYNAALRGRRYSSGISATTRMAVPIAFAISKAGNFYMETLDTTHFRRKLGEWEKSKPKAFAPWGGDTQAFMRDVFRYLDNHQNGRPGSANLDNDPAMAVHKRNVINNFFNVHGSQDANPLNYSSRGDRDNLIRSRRIDRINRIAVGGGDAFPIDYYKMKANLLPAGPGERPRVGSQAARQHVRDQAVSNFADAFRGVPRPTASRMGERYFRELDRALPRIRGESQLDRDSRIGRIMSRADDAARQNLSQAVARGGMEGSDQALKTLALRDAMGRNGGENYAKVQGKEEVRLSPADQRHLDWVSREVARSAGPRQAGVYWDPTERLEGPRGERFAVEAKFQDGKLMVNAAQLRSQADIRAVVREEIGHQMLATPKGQKLLEEFMGKHGLTDAQRQELAAAGYHPLEGESLKQYTQRLHDEFIAKQARIGWFTDLTDRLVTTVKRALGISLTQEQAARAILRQLRSVDNGLETGVSSSSGSIPERSASPREPGQSHGVEPASVVRLNVEGFPVEPDGGMNAANVLPRYALRKADEWAARFLSSKAARKVYSAAEMVDFVKGMEMTRKIFGDFSLAPEEVPGNAVRDNSDRLFRKTGDLSTICPQQDQYVAVISALERERGKIFNPHERFKIGLMIAEVPGFKPACWYCYGQTGRNMFDFQLGKAAEIFNALNNQTGGRPPTVPEMAAQFGKWKTDGDLGAVMTRYIPEARAAGLVLDPVRMRDIARRWAEPATPLEGQIAEGLRGWAQAATKANEPKPFSPYNNEILQTSDADIAAFNRAAGFRFNSQTDFRPWHVLDTAQMLAHLKMKKGMAHVYLRTPDFIEVAGAVGIKFNMSVEFAHGIHGELLRNPDGSVMWNDMNGMPQEKALEFRKRHPRDVGTMLVAMTEEDVLEGFRNPHIDMMIPFHKGSVDKETVAYQKATDFSKYQHENWKGQPRTRDVIGPDGQPVLTSKGNIKQEPITRRVKLNNGKTVTVTVGEAITREHHGNSKEQYLELCEKLGITPRFAKYVNEPGYMKVVRDVAREPSNQQVVDPSKFNWQAASDIVQKWIDRGGHPADVNADPRLLSLVRKRVAYGDWPRSPLQTKTSSVNTEGVRSTAAKVQPLAMTPVRHLDGLPVYEGAAAHQELRRLYGIPNAITTQGETPFQRGGQKRVLFVDDFNEG